MSDETARAIKALVKGIEPSDDTNAAIIRTDTHILLIQVASQTAQIDFATFDSPSGKIFRGLVLSIDDLERLLATAKALDSRSEDLS